MYTGKIAKVQTELSEADQILTTDSLNRDYRFYPYKHMQQHNYSYIYIIISNIVTCI